MKQTRPSTKKTFQGKHCQNRTPRPHLRASHPGHLPSGPPYLHSVYIMIVIIIIIIIIVIIVSITKFLIVIGSPRAYLSRNRRTITWVSDYRCPI